MIKNKNSFKVINKLKNKYFILKNDTILRYVKILIYMLNIIDFVKNVK